MTAIDDVKSRLDIVELVSPATLRWIAPGEGSSPLVPSTKKRPLPSWFIPTGSPGIATAPAPPAEMFSAS